VSALLNLPAMQSLRERLPAFRAVEKTGCLPEELAQRVLGPELRTSVSSLERFAACPFQFFVHHTLRGRERPQFELGVRERGSFSHEVLAAYHRRLEREGLRWRDLSPDMARATVRDAASEVAGTFHEGLLKTGHAARFSTAVMTRRVEDFVAMETAWMRRYAFDPWKVEVCFGLGEEPELPAWRINLADGRALVLVGKIDRVDVQRDEAGARAVVIDYKSEGRTLDSVLMRHGVSMQLPAYLNALRQAGAAAFGTSVIPAGMFYAPLRGKHGVSDNRDEEAAGGNSMEDVWRAFQFRGRFAREMVQQFDCDAVPGSTGSHFSFRIKKDGGFHAKNDDPKSEADFTALLDENVETLRQMAERIYQGEARLDPYKKGKQRACDRCECQAICRVDLWSQPFRELSAEAKEEEAS
jgi:ATP-dependent helicase/nuclease subunit B